MNRNGPEWTGMTPEWTGMDRNEGQLENMDWTLDWTLDWTWTGLSTLSGKVNI